MSHASEPRARVGRRAGLRLARPCLEVMEDRLLLTQFTVTNISDDGSVGSLRWAIQQADQGPGGDKIVFAIPGSGLQQIHVQTALPKITVPLTIDGTSQHDYAGVPLIAIVGPGGPTGTNAFDGLAIAAGNTTIEGLAITNFGGNGITISAGSHNIIVSNYIGVLPGSPGASPNGGDGIQVLAGDSVQIGVGDGNQRLGNVISGNGGFGIDLHGGLTPIAGAIVDANFIGTDPTGSSRVGNGSGGILANGLSTSMIGGSFGNVISGNNGAGVLTTGKTDGLVIDNNLIGKAFAGDANLGNLGDGIRLVSSNNIIGGQAGNTIMYNGNPQTGSGAGVSLVGGVLNNAILSNVIASNVGLGIDLGGSGNHQQQPPTLRAMSRGTQPDSVSILGTMSGVPGQTYTIQFYANSKDDPSGYGEGEVFLGSQNLRMDANGSGVINATFLRAVPLGYTLTATATDASGNTSGFARNLPTTDTPDVAVGIQPTSGRLAVGDSQTYLITVTNVGAVVALGVTVTDFLPAGTALVSATTTGALATGSNSLIVNFGNLRPGDTGTLTVVVRTTAAAAPSITNTAIVATISGDNNAGNNVASVTTPVGNVSDLSVQVQASDAKAIEGQTVTYTVTLTNLGPNDASGVTLIDTLPAGTTIVSASSSLGQTAINGSVITTTLASLALSDGPVILTVVVLPSADPDVPIYTNTATVTSSTFDPSLGNNTASASTIVSNLALSLAAPAAVQVGDELTYTAQLTNVGTTTATGISVAGLIPAGLVFNGGFPGAAIDANGNIVATVASLAPGETISIPLSFQVTQAASSNVAFNLAATLPPSDVHLAEASASTDVQTVANLGVVIRPHEGSILAGQTATYDLVVTNQGPSEATGVILRGAIPAGVTIKSIATSQGDFTASDGGFDVELANLLPGISATVTVVVQAGNAAPSFTLSANVVANVFDSDPSDNFASVTTAVAPSANLSVQVTPPNGPLFVGRAFPYIVTVTNHGPYDATNVSVVNTLTAGVSVVSAVDGAGNRVAIASSGVVTDSIASLKSGASVTLTLSVVSSTDQLVTDRVTVTSDLPDADESDNTASASAPVARASDLTVSISGDSSTVNAGQTVTYTVTATNRGPSQATNVVLKDVLPQGAVFVSAGPGIAGVSQSGNVVTLGIGALDVGASRTVSFVIRADQIANTSNSISISSDEDDLATGNNLAKASLNVLESPGSFSFANAVFGVTNNAGRAVITVVRQGGARGPATVVYCTPEGGTAKPGVDFLPVAGTLTFQPGQTIATFSVPIIAYAYNQTDPTIALRLITPTGGPTLGDGAASTIWVNVLNKDTVAPDVQEIRLSGPSTGLGDVTLFFNKPLDAASALDPSHFQVVSVGADGRFGTGDDSPVGVSAVSYNPANNTVNLHFATPLGSNQFYHVRVVGVTDPGGLRIASGVYDAYFGRGSTLVYPDSRGSSVTLRLNGGGVLDLTRFANGDGNRLQILNPVFRRSTLMGRVTGGSSTSLASVTGLGSFGQVKLRLSTPPFYVNQMPFGRSIMSPASVDTVLDSGVPQFSRQALMALARLRRR
ncbi:beta strand repeat-containing protein [Singulisphaera sp. PoT]|uniref:beta strand repeat-containing protein n=1 Tax=Singulisphaera sp. PoT TaxID=3411797 RepID=UPI003BF55E84